MYRISKKGEIFFFIYKIVIVQMRQTIKRQKWIKKMVITCEFKYEKKRKNGKKRN